MIFRTIAFVAVLPILLPMAFSTTASDQPLSDNTSIGLSLSPTQSKARNPHSKALGQRITGGILVGLGSANLVSGIIIDAGDLIAENYDDLGMRDFGDMLEKVTWIEGSVMLCVGVPLLIVGGVKFARWRQWEAEHGRTVSLNANGLTIEF